MSRVKNFNSTGIAPDGKLYAGDLNQIQDHYADLSDFTQTVDLSTLRIGDSSIQIVKYGAAEARLTAALRADGIVRGLGGIIAGAFTDATRDAIPTGFAPFGVVILNSQRNEYQWNNGTDGARNWIPLGVLSGTFAARPAAGTPGRQYYDTTNKLTWADTGTKWIPADGLFPGAEIDYSGPVGSLSGIQEVKPGWLLENGATLNRAGTYADLFAEIGTAFGAGDGSTTFLIPNAMGRVSVPMTPSGTFATRGAAGGEETHALSVAELAPHHHGDLIMRSFAPSSGNFIQFGTSTTTLHTFTDTADTGGGAEHNNLQPYIVKGARLMRYL